MSLLSWPPGGIDLSSIFLGNEEFREARRRFREGKESEEGSGPCKLLPSETLLSKQPVSSVARHGGMHTKLFLLLFC
jgi:hypothetical protein